MASQEHHSGKTKTRCHGGHFRCILFAWRSSTVCAVVSRGVIGAKAGRCAAGNVRVRIGTGHAGNWISQTKPPITLHQSPAVPRPSNAFKQTRQALSQSLGDLLQVDKRNIPHTPLYAAVICPVKTATLRRLFLIDFLFLADATDCTTEPDAYIDGSHSLQSSNPVADAYTPDESH